MKTNFVFNPTSGALDVVKYADSHAELLNRTAADSHPIGAVAGTVAGAIPYVGAANALVESASLAWDATNKTAAIGGEWSVAGDINGNINSYMNRLIAGIPTNPLAWETGVTGPGGGAFYGGVLLPNGKVFCVPGNYTSNQNIYNPATNAWETGVTCPGSSAFLGGVLLPNGNVFCVPYSYTSNQNIYNPCVIGWPYGQWMLHPMFNKL